MDIGLITVRDANYPPNFRLSEAAAAQGHRVLLLHPYRMWPAFHKGRPILIGDENGSPDIVVPRQGATLGDTCLSLIRHFQLMGIPVVNGMDAVRRAKDKFLSLQTLQEAGIPIPETVLVNTPEGLETALSWMGEYPLVVKPVSSRQGTGIERIQSLREARNIAEKIDRRTGLLVQRFIPPEGRKDIRVLIIGKEAAGAAEFSPNPGDFRGNFHLSGKSRAADPGNPVLDLAVAAAEALGLEIAGIDILVDADHRPFVIEVNYAPGFRGLEAATGLDIAGTMVRYFKKRYQASRKNNPRQMESPPESRIGFFVENS